MQTVTVTLKDIFTEQLIERTICASNICVADSSADIDFEHHEIAAREKQAELLKRWIAERANEQHDTTLELVSWVVNEPDGKSNEGQMEFHEIKALATAMRDAVGLPAEYYPVLVLIQDEHVSGTGPAYDTPSQYAPHYKVILGDGGFGHTHPTPEEALMEFAQWVADGVKQVASDARHEDVRTRWAARRAARSLPVD